MVKLEKGSHAALYRLYRANDFFFPLIATVLLDEQNGAVFVNDVNRPAQVYVEHAFGFAQIFGKRVEKFEEELERYLFIDKLFSPDKVRLYAPYLPGFLASSVHESLRSYRQRFHMTAESFSRRSQTHFKTLKDSRLGGVDAANVEWIESKFGMVRRFWRTPDDFIKKANAMVVFYKGTPASICYSAAEADHCAEIDVLTLPEHRKIGFAKQAVIGFINRCFSLSLRPLWDCFTNNAGSMSICKSVGFTAVREPYPFFTINK